eukprot:m.37679 g.37679  ORF g.37679 m.37679 type:complete len:449 (+) comp11125_c0_seq1:512-1858(+)
MAAATLSPERQCFGSLSVGTYNVLLHGFAFMCLFTAFQTSGAFQTAILTDVLHDSNLGFISLSVIYFVFAFGNFISPNVVAMAGTRVCLFLGSAFYALFIAAFLKPSSHLILAASAALGLAAAILWTAQGQFITLSGTHRTRGRNAGVFWAMLQCSLLIGNLLALFVLPATNGTTQAEKDHLVHEAHFFYQLLFGIAMGGVLLLLLLRRVAPVGDSDALLGANVEPKPSAIELFKSTFALLLTKEVLLIAPAMAYTGLELTFWSARYPTVLGGKLKGVTLPKEFDYRAIGYSGLVVGTAEIIGGMLMGKVADRFGRSWVIVVAMGFHAVSLFVIYVNFLSGVMTPDLRVALACSFGLGFGDSCLNTAMYAILSGLWTDQASQAFALYKFYQSAFAGIAFVYAGYLALEYQLLILGVMLLLGCWGFLRVERLGQHSANAPRYAEVVTKR